jgi:hypothetical protein
LEEDLVYCSFYWISGEELLAGWGNEIMFLKVIHINHLKKDKSAGTRDKNC